MKLVATIVILAAFFSTLLFTRVTGAAEHAFADTLGKNASRSGSLTGTALDSGDARWVGEKSIIVADDSFGGLTTNNPAGGTIAHPIPRMVGSYILKAEIRPPKEGSLSVGLGRETMPTDYYGSSVVSVGMARGGLYEVKIGRGKPVKAGTAKDYGGLTPDGTANLVLTFDAAAAHLTVNLNGVDVLHDVNLKEQVTAPKVAFAGMRINGTAVVNDPRVRNYSVTAASSVTSGLAVRDSTEFFVTPGKASTITWQASSVAGTQIEYELLDYAGKHTGTGVAKVGADGLVRADVNLTPGYYELLFTATGERFGVFASPVIEPSDSFFGIDAALTWLEPRSNVREQLIKILRRSGIGAARERLSWGNVDAASNNGDWEGGQRTDTIRKAYADNGVKLLEIMYSAGAKYRIDEGSIFPEKFGPAAASWQKIAKRYSGNWIGDEIWNEPDLVQQPADQYATLPKMAAYAHEQGGIAAPIVLGAFTGMSPSTYHEVCAANGALDYTNAVSFHTYDAAIQLGDVVGKYREWFAANGKESMPLWLTEAGKAWPVGPERPSIEPDIASAHAIAALASEAKAVGIARLFPFVYVYYEEGPKNFGMMGRDVTPLRLMAAYANAVRVLSGKPYVGDLDVTEGVNSLRVFGDGDEQVIVVYMKKVDAAAKVTLPAKPIRVEGIDGRALEVAADGSISVPDGIAFAYARKSDLATAIKTDSPTHKLYEIAQRPAPARTKASPVIVQHVIEKSQVKMSSRRYLLTESAAKLLKITARAGNMSDRSLKVTLHLKLPGDAPATPIESKTLELPAMGHAEASWTVDASSNLDVAEVRYVKVEGDVEGSDQKISPLAIPFIVEGDIDSHLARHSYKQAVPINELDRWKRNHAENGKLTFATQNGGVFRMDVKFTQPSSRWVYPTFKFAEPFDATKATGLLIRARIIGKAKNVAVMLRESDHPGFWAMEIYPADGEWHVVYLPFGEFRPELGNPDMQNAVLKPEKLKSMQVGMGSNVDENAMEISHFLIVGQERAQ